jgi:hypothetical protein
MLNAKRKGLLHVIFIPGVPHSSPETYHRQHCVGHFPDVLIVRTLASPLLLP